MIKFTRLCALIICLFFIGTGCAQNPSAVDITYDYQRANDSEIIFNIHAKINPGIPIGIKKMYIFSVGAMINPAKITALTAPEAPRLL